MLAIYTKKLLSECQWGHAIMLAMQHDSSSVDHPSERTNDWLADRLAHIWYHYFSDIAQPNEVIIKFGRKSRTRLGSIAMPGWRDQQHGIAYRTRQAIPEGTTVITITGYFKDQRVPEYAVDATIGHELVHYAHGFHSPHPQLHAHPHKGGIVDRELRQRGMGETLKQQKSWLRQSWLDIIGPIRHRRRRKRTLRISLLPAYQRKRS